MLAPPLTTGACVRGCVGVCVIGVLSVCGLGAWVAVVPLALSACSTAIPANSSSQSVTHRTYNHSHTGSQTQTEEKQRSKQEQCYFQNRHAVQSAATAIGIDSPNTGDPYRSACYGPDWPPASQTWDWLTRVELIIPGRGKRTNRCISAIFSIIPITVSLNE